MSDEKKTSNVRAFSNWIKATFGDDVYDRILEAVGGENAIANASFATTRDTGGAYVGSLLPCVFEISKTAKSINRLLPEEVRADDDSITKVALLSHIAKVVMFSENDNQWEINNRGIVFKFNDLEGALRCGERSLLIAMNAGITFTPSEFEAMRIMDKTSNDDNYTKYYSSALSTVIRQANELVTLYNKNKKNEY